MEKAQCWARAVLVRELADQDSPQTGGGGNREQIGFLIKLQRYFVAGPS